MFVHCTVYTTVSIQLCQSHGKLKERAPEWLKQMFHNLEERPPSNQTMFAKSVPFCKLKLKSDLCNFCHLSHYQNHHSDPGPKSMVVGHVDVDDLSYWYLDFWVGRHISKSRQQRNVVYALTNDHWDNVQLWNGDHLQTARCSSFEHWFFRSHLANQPDGSRSSY